jgi:hypothetical protein
MQLSQWLIKQQSLQHLGKLDKDKEAQLTAIGVPWLDFSRRLAYKHWWEQYEVLPPPPFRQWPWLPMCGT